MESHYVYLVYGLSFVVMGFSMAYQSFSAFRILPRRPLLLLAAFGITHGLFELQRMFQMFEMRGVLNASPVVVDYITLFLLPISFMLLLAFGVELMIHEKIFDRRSRVLYLIGPMILTVLVLKPDWSKFQSLDEWPLRLETAARYFLALPAGVLSSLAILKIAARSQDHEKLRFVMSMYISAAFLFAYGIVAGILMLNPVGFSGFPEHGISSEPILLTLRSIIAIGLTVAISYAFIIELANIESSMRRMRDEFSAVLAHDIGNIVSAIKISSDMISSERSTSKLGEKTKQLIKTISSNTKLLQSLISELFDLSLIELHRFQLDRRVGDLREVVTQTCEQMRPLLGNRALVLLMPDMELAAEFDRQRIGQILINLLSNAAKYSFPESEVLVTAYESGLDIKITVTSTGPVIPRKEAAQLFTRYYRAKSVSKQKGAGLGLFIVKELAEAHKGKVFVESHESGETVFGFTIPKKLAQKNGAPLYLAEVPSK